MFPGIHTESETLCGYISEMLDGVRNAAFGLTDEQARQTPTRSRLSIGGIIKHCAWVMQATTVRTINSGTSDSIDDFRSSFTPTQEETLEVLLARFDELRARYLQTIAAIDPAGEMTVGPQPWDGITEDHQASNRLLLAHHIDEFARHAGHADIIREQLDGADAMSLRFAVEGREANAYVQPWEPEGS